MSNSIIEKGDFVHFCQGLKGKVVEVEAEPNTIFGIRAQVEVCTSKRESMTLPRWLPVSQLTKIDAI